MAIDSFTVDNGQTVAIDRHFARFTAATQALSAPSVAALPDFFRHVVAELAESTSFPRLELVADANGAQRLQLNLRPALPTKNSVEVWVGTPGDLRQFPRLKGPDLDLIQRLQAEAAGYGCDEYLICGKRGEPLEGAYSALLWWRGDSLCALPADAPVLPSFTRDVVFEIAKEQGLSVARAWPTLAELQASETWLVNARHGIRTVSQWSQLGEKPPAPDRMKHEPSERAVHWQERWLARRRPLLQWSDRSQNHDR